MAKLKPTPLLVLQGRTFERVVRWETEPFMFTRIASIANVAPVRITTIDPHGLLPGWRVAVVDAIGLDQLNAKSNPPKDKDFHRVTVVDNSTIELNPLSAAAWDQHLPNTGYLQWYSPADILDFVGRMAIRPRVGGDLLFQLTTEPGGGLEIDFATREIRISINALITEAFSWTAAVYDLELESPEGVVTAILAGPITVEREITTTITP
jgi:hypothetical protein